MEKKVPIRCPRTLTHLALFSLLPAIILTAHGALRTWDGGGGDNFWTTAANWNTDTAPAAGDDLLFPPVASRLINSNNFTAGTIFSSVTLAGGGYSLRGALVALNAGLTNLAGGNFLRFPITLRSNQTFSASGGFIFLNADIDTAGRTLTMEVTAGSEIQVISPIAGSGGIRKIGSGLLTMSVASSYSGLTDILQGRMDLTHNNALGLATAGTTVSSGAYLSLDAPAIAEPLVLAGTLLGPSSDTIAVWSGPVALVSNSASIEVGSRTLKITGVISGTGSLNKRSQGTLWLTANNTYTGPTTNHAGTLIIDGVQRSSPICVEVGSILKGTGTVAEVTCFDSIFGLSPQIIIGESGIGRLTTSNLFMSAATYLTVTLGGTAAGTGYGQLSINGSVSLANASLAIITGPGFVPVVGNSFVIIDNDGTDPVLGQFRFLPEGTIFNGDGYPLQITYHGGTGNDVVLTRVNPGFQSITASPTAVSLAVTGAVANVTYTIQAVTNLSPSIQWSDIGFAQANFNGQFTFVDPDAPLFPRRFYRVLLP